MEVLVLRHARAEDVAVTDEARELTGKGEGQAVAVGRFCAGHRLVPGLILTSPVVRAERTARLVARECGVGVEVREDARLACGASSDDILGVLGEVEALARRVMVVGHQPDLGDFLAFALGLGSGAAIAVGKGSLSGLELAGARSGSARLLFHLPPKLMSGHG